MKIMISLKIDKDLKERLAEIAKEENRSLSNLIETVLMKYAEQHEKPKKKQPKK
ncbi:MAG: ribbon-helix-helix protein, CopG family [Desulfobacteraceae bacterium]|nr:MAG: ribbon-helix-helix protein, CopG family [Desulfobacteraceae bacterium]